MKKVYVALLLAVALMCSQVTFASAPPQQDVHDIRDYISDNFDGYNVVFIDIDPMARLSDTATISGNSIAIITTPFSLKTGEPIGLSFTMTRKTENVTIAVGRSDQTVGSIVFVKPTITKSGIFNVIYTYESMFYVSSTGDYYLMIKNAEEDSISISSIKITIPQNAIPQD